jgi:hypothetical protein
VKLALLAIRLCAARVLRYRIVWTAHQVLPHETSSRRLDRAGARIVARTAHSIIVHDDATRRSLDLILGSRAARKAAIVPHGTFADAYRPGRARAEVRSDLGLGEDTFVFLAFGHVRAYKDLDLLLDGFRVAGLDDAALVIAGQPHDGGVVAEIMAAAERDPRIVPLLRFVEDDRVAELFGAVDAAVVSRRDGGTSGVLVLAQAFGVPVVAADTASYREALGGEAAGWLFAPGDVDSLADALASAASASAEARARGGRAAVPTSWDEVGARTAAVYAAAVADEVGVLLVCSSGGHLLQLRALAAAWAELPHAWVVEDTADTRSVLAAERASFLKPVAPRDLLGAVRNAALAWRQLRRLRPDVVVTTGAAIAVPFAWIARLLRIRVVYIESITRIERPSLSCRLIAPVADRVYVQWPELVEHVRNARYVGAVLETT